MLPPSSIRQLRSIQRPPSRHQLLLLRQLLLFEEFEAPSLFLPDLMLPLLLAEANAAGVALGLRARAGTAARRAAAFDLVDPRRKDAEFVVVVFILDAGVVVVGGAVVLVGDGHGVQRRRGRRWRRVEVAVGGEDGVGRSRRGGGVTREGWTARVRVRARGGVGALLAGDGGRKERREGSDGGGGARDGGGDGGAAAARTPKEKRGRRRERVRA